MLYAVGMTKTTTRKMAHDLQVGDVINHAVSGTRWLVTQPVQPGLFGSRGVRITTVGLHRLGREDSTHVDPDIYFLSVED